jgi:hypothetical protein
LGRIGQGNAGHFFEVAQPIGQVFKGGVPRFGGVLGFAFFFFLGDVEG